MKMQKSKIPGPEDLKRPTMRLLSLGLRHTDDIRARLLQQCGILADDLSREAQNRFINNHAWSLVRLQRDGLIQRLGAKRYALTEAGNECLRDPRPTQAVEPPVPGATPKWAKRLVSSAKRRNGKDGPDFTEQDLLVLWRRCAGRCEMTGLEFSEEQVGNGKAKRAFAPSLDKIDPDKPYTLDNCRLVMVAVNFALNAWGEDVYLMLAENSVSMERRRKDNPV